jgi:hypothetical protein
LIALVQDTGSRRVSCYSKAKHITERRIMTKDEKAIEATIQDKGLTAKRITPDMLDSEIISARYHVFPGSCLTVCCLT